MITVQDLTKSFGSFQALAGISFSVGKGEVVGLLGPNGAGKTTTMRLMTGFLKPSSGKVLINGTDVTVDPESAQQKIGYLPEHAPLYADLTAYEYLEFVAETHGITGNKKEQAIRRVAEATGLTERLHFTAGELSKGYRQRVGLAAALIHDPDVLILDEPTTGLDPNQIVEIRELIKKLGEEKTIILSTHIMQEVEAICSRVIVVSAGKIVAEGAPAELTENKKASHELRVVIGGKATEAAEVLKSVTGVKKVTRIPGAERGTAIFVVSSDSDLRSDITKAIFKAKLELLEIGIERQTMEDVFSQVTK